MYTRGWGKSEDSQWIVIPTNPSFQHARSLGAAGGYTGNDDNDDNGDNDEYDERGVSPPPLSPWLIQRSSRESLFLLSCLLPLDRKSFEIDRSFASFENWLVPVAVVRVEIILQISLFFFFFSRGS